MTGRRGREAVHAYYPPNTAASSGLTGQLAELIYVKRKLTAAEDAALTEYLNDRYGLSLTGVTQ
ncbi:MAG: hypothetical protein KC619_35890 [Myxococcales bacterium]|nr:hypothetical protein [Myxococcales bacterium]